MLALSGFCVFGVFRHGAVGSAFIAPVFDENGNETGETRVISGEEIYATYLKTEGTLDGRVMDAAFFQKMLDNVPELEKGFEQAVHFATEDATYQTAFGMVTGLLPEPRNVTAEKFYAAQWEQTRRTKPPVGCEGSNQIIL